MSEVAASEEVASHMQAHSVQSVVERLLLKKAPNDATHTISVHLDKAPDL